MNILIFLFIVFWVIVPRLREQEKTRNATNAARQEAAKRAQQLRQDPPTPRGAQGSAQRTETRAAQYTYPTAAQRNAAAQNPPEQQARYRAVRPEWEAAQNRNAGRTEQGASQRQDAGRTEPSAQKQDGKKKFKDFLTLLGGILGTVGAASFGTGAIVTIAEVIDELFHGYFFAVNTTAPVILTILAVACGLGARKCFISRQRAKRYDLYKTIIGTQRTCPVADIARASGRKPKKVLRDLQDMVRDGFFPLGFVDEETACFYADNNAYRTANPERARAQDAALAERDAASAEEQRQAVPEPEADNDDGGALSEDDLRALRKEIAHVENPDIREKASHLARHAEDIFAWVKLHPECADDVRRFCSYYLPTAAKLLATYNEIAPHAGESSVAASVETEVSKVLDTMIAAYRELMDHLLQNTAVDMQAEISALETVLAQEGLTQNGLKL